MSCFLVTGCAGFIAHRVCEMLLEDGHYVVGVDNLNDYYDVSIKEFRLAKLKEFSNFKFELGDIEDKILLSSLFDEYKFDTVLNLAARAGVRYSIENPDIYMSTNINGTLNLLEQMKKNGIKKFVLASTSSLYAGQQMPFSENLPVNTPISPYAASKKAAEALAYSYHHLHNIDVSIVRYFTVFGPIGRPDMCIFRFIKWIDDGEAIELFGDGEQSRDFTYVDDIARGTIKSAMPLGYEVINLGGGNKPISLNYVIDKIEKKLKKKAKIRNEAFMKADIISTWAEIDKAKKLLDWSPRYTFLEGLNKTIDFYLENKSFFKNITL